MAKEKIERFIVTPATDNAHKEPFIRINGKVIVFGIPIPLTKNDVMAIKNIKEPKRVDTGVDVHKLMDQLKLPQEKVNKMLKSDPSMRTNSNVKYIRKYNISKA